VPACRRRLTLPYAQAAVDSVVAQISGVAARGSRLCLDAVPLGLVEGRVKPRRGWINGRDVRGPPCPALPCAANRTGCSAVSSLDLLVGDLTSAPPACGRPSLVGHVQGAGSCAAPC